MGLEQQKSDKWLLALFEGAYRDPEKLYFELKGAAAASSPELARLLGHAAIQVLKHAPNSTEATRVRAELKKEAGIDVGFR